MLMDVLGIIIGFVTIVLLLSILVTALVQTLTSFSGRRHKALELGISESDIAATLATVVDGVIIANDKGENAIGPFVTAVENAKALTTSAKLIAAMTHAIDAVPDNCSVKDLLKYVLETARDDQHVDQVRQLFERAGESLQAPKDESKSQALVQAVEGLVRGSSDERRKQLPELVGKGINRIKGVNDTRILTDLVKKTVARAATDKRVTWIEDKEVVEPLQVAGVPATGVEAVRLTLDQARQTMDAKFLQWARALTFIFALVVAVTFQASVPDILTKLQGDAALRAEAEKLARGLTAGDESQKPANVDATVADLAKLGIEPITNTSFYWTTVNGKTTVHGDHILGVLFMAVLLSFGAPFWYRMLKELIGFKDALRKKEDQGETVKTVETTIKAKTK